MKKTYYNKLIRDNTPRVFAKEGGKHKTRVLLKKEFGKELKKKLLEESKELIEAPEKEMINELSDVLEVIKSIASHYKIKFKEVEKYQITKRKKRGSFSKKLFLVWSSDK